MMFYSPRLRVSLIQLDLFLYLRGRRETHFFIRRNLSP